MKGMQTRSKTTVVVAVLVVYGIYSTLLGLVMIFAPGFFFDTAGGFGTRNSHYIFDNATFELPFGLLYLAALKWPSWRVPALAFATVHYLLHAVSHLIDINNANTHWIGVFDFVVIAIGTVIHALALWFSVQLQGATSAEPQPD
jgi:hypothetical protein